MSKEATIAIATASDLKSTFRKNKLELIVDPMVFRSADVFLRGGQGATASLPEKDTDKLWAALSDNIGSVVAFFDALVLSEKLPIIDYGITFDSALRPGQPHKPPWVCDTINTALEDDVLVDVHIHGAASKMARAAALKSLQSRPQAPPDLEKSVRNELSAFDYQWSPDLGELGELKEEKRDLARFLYGGLVFTAFAKMSASAHLLQPKRARLFTAMALGTSSTSEKELFQELNRRVRATPGFEEVNLEINSLPPVLPYLLSKGPQKPLDLLRQVRKLRKMKMTEEYRDWQSRLIRNWTDKGFIEPSQERDVKRLIAAFQKHLTVRQELPVEVGMEMKIDATGVGIGLTGKLDVPVGSIWGWVLSNIPGHRYLKLLQRLSESAYSYPQLDRALGSLWGRNP
jgi:hypothetical protein